MKDGRGGGKKCKVPTHLIENSKLSPVARVTKTEAVECNHMVHICMYMHTGEATIKKTCRSVAVFTSFTLQHFRWLY